MTEPRVRRGGGRCPSCKILNYVIERPMVSEHPVMTPEDYEALKARTCCGNCGGSLRGVVLETFPLDVDAVEAVAPPRWPEEAAA